MSSAAPSTSQPASPRLRIEVFPASQAAALDFYLRVLRFSHSIPPDPNGPPPGQDAQGNDTYTHIKRGAIGIGLYPSRPADGDLAALYKLRATPIGTELVFVLPTLEDLHAERAYILEQGWALDRDLEYQHWGLWDFRIRDPDGFYWRLTTERPPST